ncbi:MAG: N-acyl homoserine lactonase family protein [Thermodesulfobacteriota bacterium]|jgi:glyoxylase-like metal-dependent hydrolase (beta-lactamase superfamily II)
MMREYTLIPLPIGKILLDKSMMTYRLNMGEKIDIPYFSWYVKGADKNIIIDTGIDATHAMKYHSSRSPVRFTDIQLFEDALASQGLKPEDIDYVIQTHGAYDHTGNTAKCKNATIFMQEEEWKFAMSPHPVLREIYQPHLLSGWHRLQLVKGDVPDLFPGIDLIFAPGHGPGVQAVSVNTKKGKAVISGFCCVQDNFVPREDMKPYYPVTPSGIHVNPLQAFESMVRVAGLADILLPQHEPSLLNVKSIP